MMKDDLTETLARAIARECTSSVGDHERAATAAIEAIKGAGYAIVPREPTRDMLIAGILERHDQQTPEAWSLATANIYRAMIQAAEGERGVK